MADVHTRLAELTERLAALDRERAAITAEIEALRFMPSFPIGAGSGQAAHGIDRHSTIEAKIALFRRLFRGRTEILPVRWENAKTGRSGYSPACTNEWRRGVCEKPKVKCSACPNQAFIGGNDASI
jgi:hypothetical protein